MPACSARSYELCQPRRRPTGKPVTKSNPQSFARPRKEPPIWRAASGTCSGLSGRQIRAFGAAVSSGRPFVLAGTRHAGGGQVRGLSGLVDAVGSAKHRRPSTHTRTRALFIDGIGIVDQVRQQYFVTVWVLMQVRGTA